MGNGMELAQHLPNDMLLMAQSCSKVRLPVALSWPSPSLKRPCRQHGIGPAPLEIGIANGMELAQNLMNDVLLMAHSGSKVVLPIALNWPGSSLKGTSRWQRIRPPILGRGTTAPTTRTSRTTSDARPR